jgi:FtsP/CotA-like multicopper oxidase with cupredoxin domain
MSDHVTITRAKGAQLASFSTISRQQSDMAFWQNQDSEAHYPTFPPGAPVLSNQVGPHATSGSVQPALALSTYYQSTGPLPLPQGRVFPVNYTCSLHQGETGFAHRFALTSNGQPVSPDSNVDQCQKVNTRWDWNLLNSSASASQVHAFHIHINPFQILEITYIDANGKPAVYTPQEPPLWSGVVNIPQTGLVRIRQAFDDFTGTYVLHCHILAHEDRGMMQLVRTIPANADPDKACKLNGVQHH